MDLDRLADPGTTASSHRPDGSERAARAGIAGVGGLIGLAAATVVELAAMGLSAPGRVVAAALLGLAAAGFAHAAVARPLLQEQRRERRRWAASRRQDALAVARAEIVGRAANALAIAGNEGEALSAVAAATRELLPDRDVELLLCASPDARVAWTARVGAAGVDAPVSFTGDGRCIAAATHLPAATATTTAFDACPHVVADQPVSSLCVPVTVGQTTIALLHTTGPEGELVDAAALGVISRIAALGGARITDLRPVASELDVETPDPLTGLPNHRAAHRVIKELIGGLTPFSLAVCDLDGLEAYNEQHGTESGDRAIRLFASALRTTLRPGDVVVRWGGDEFLVVFPRCSSLNAQAAMERVRERMVLSLADAEMAPFTCSTGVADSNQGASIDELIETADLALSVAKHEGGNRVRTAVF